jgi:hypothetical protein
MTNRKKPGIAFWATLAVLVALVAYPLSYGPACWMAWQRRSHSAVRITATIYSPLVWASFNGPERIQRALWWWAEFYAPPSVKTTEASSSGYTTETISVVHLLYGELVQ